MSLEGGALVVAQSASRGPRGALLFRTRGGYLIMEGRCSLAYVARVRPRGAGAVSVFAGPRQHAEA